MVILGKKRRELVPATLCDGPHLHVPVRENCTGFSQLLSRGRPNRTIHPRSSSSNRYSNPTADLRHSGSVENVEKTEPEWTWSEHTNTSNSNRCASSAWHAWHYWLIINHHHPTTSICHAADVTKTHKEGDWGVGEMGVNTWLHTHFPQKVCFYKHNE